MKKAVAKALVLIVVVLMLSPAAGAANTVVRFDTSLGFFDVELFDDTTPNTVANFLNYVNDGDYTNSFFHRLSYDFVLQGGAFTYDINTDFFDFVPVDPPVVNEPVHSNLRGTIAMAKVAGDPNSATSQFFVNLKNNSAILDGQNGGFTPFGQVQGNGMEVVDRLAAYPPNPDNVMIADASSVHPAFGELPLIDFTPNTGQYWPHYLEMVNSITVLSTNITAPTRDLKDGDPLETANIDAFGDGQVGGHYGVWLRGDGTVGLPDYRWTISGGPEGLPETELAAVPDTDLDGAVDDYFLTFSDLAAAGARDRGATAPYTLTLEALDGGGTPISSVESQILVLVPEPISVGLLAIGGLAILRRRKL